MPPRRRSNALSGWTVLVMWLAAAGPRAALASSDYTCWPRWTLKGSTFDACNNVPFLSPTNDSRVNLLLLLVDSGQLAIAAPPSDLSRQVGYALVPFTLHDVSARDERTNAGTATPDETPKSLRELAAQVGIEAVSSPPHAGDSFPAGEGNRCRSNTEDSARAFLGAVIGSSELPDAERRPLAEARLDLLGGCAGNKDTLDRITGAKVQSPLGMQFVTYLRGAIAFYGADYDDARRDFDSLRDSRQPWLKEAARYMIGRTELNRAQKTAFDGAGYPSLDHVDRPALEASEAAFDGYLRDYPTGLYAASARGLLRRVYWLMDDRRRLAREYARAFAPPDASQRNVSAPELAREIDNKLLSGGAPDDVEDPRLLAVTDLMAMRPRVEMVPAGPGEYRAVPVDVHARFDAIRGRLEAQRPFFAQSTRLYDYLSSASLFFVAGDPDGTLKRLPDAVPSAPLDYVAFSQQTLRGFALEAKSDWPAALKIWRALLPVATRPLQRQQLELAIAANFERSGRVADVFASDSPIETPQIRKILLQHTAGPALLRQRCTAAGANTDEREAALFTLLCKDLTRRRYREFVTDLALLPKDAVQPVTRPGFEPLPRTNPAIFHWPGGKTESGYTCPSIRDVGVLLQKNPKAPVGLNCVGEFMLRNGLEQCPLDGGAHDDDLGGARSEFPGRAYSRMDGYLEVMADEKASRDDRAYALFRAINCFAPGGSSDCGGQDIPLSRRRQWFRTLKERYAGTPWGRELKYYW